ncbi:hypothetical protein Dred_2137 [Desulforamulus reducens MI-1]|uniref:Uncharacterized protein n=1 Tax=Desulforamulus reducens (strain ATCC BAA-1160 / DSM 100696 / MI-1) TaxID=349161 RepID=A4J6F1_DESRM|nr:hypothetical protein Dred_2137 [Desulforamulus reducens MI-1]
MVFLDLSFFHYFNYITPIIDVTKLIEMFYDIFNLRCINNMQCFTSTICVRVNVPTLRCTTKFGENLLYVSLFEPARLMIKKNEVNMAKEILSSIIT